MWAPAYSHSSLLGGKKKKPILYHPPGPPASWPTTAYLSSLVLSGSDDLWWLHLHLCRYIDIYLGTDSDMDTDTDNEIDVLSRSDANLKIKTDTYLDTAQMGHAERHEWYFITPYPLLYKTRTVTLSGHAVRQATCAGRWWRLRGNNTATLLSQHCNNTVTIRAGPW